jgi:hypothetical protein
VNSRSPFSSGCCNASPAQRRQAAVGRARRRSDPDIVRDRIRAPKARSPARPRSWRKVRCSARCCHHHVGCSASRRTTRRGPRQFGNVEVPQLAVIAAQGRRLKGILGSALFARFRPPHRYEYQAADQYFGDMRAEPPVTNSCAGSRIESAEETTAMSTLLWTWPGVSNTGAFCGSLV